MSIFTIDADNNITAHASSQEATLVEGAVQFTSQASLANVSADWPASWLVEIWNGIPGNTEVTKVQDRKKALGRIWTAIQRLADDAQPSESEAKPKKAAKGVKPAKKTAPAKKGSKGERSNKKAEVIAMMKRPRV